MNKTQKITYGILYWTLQLTWCALLTIPGLLISLVCMMCGGKVHRNGFSYIVEIGNNWGGVDLGAVALCGKYSEYNKVWFNHTRCHEFGHSLQHLIFGPLQLFIVAIPSAIRYWYFRLTPHKKHQAYDYVWFEYTASKWGYYWINKIENKDFAYTYERKKKV